MIQNKTRYDLIDALAFQKQFALAVCNVLEIKFDENHIMTVFKVLGSTNMLCRQIGLANWWMVDLELLCGQYEIEHKIEVEIETSLH